MGTHPIFESDFDCLTELCKKMVELESPVHVHCDKETPVHVYVRKNGAKTKSATKTRARSPTKKRSEQASSPSRRPWIPAPGRSTLSDLKAEMARAGRPVDRDVCVQQRRVEKADQDVESLAAEITAKASKEDDEYTEVASNVQVVEDVVVEEAQLKPLVEPAVSRVYASHYEPELNALLDADRSRLQKLLLSAELDLETLDFSDPQASARFLTTSRHIRAELAALKRANFDVSRLEQQRDAVIERLAKSDSEITLARRALYGKESDLRETQIDNELNQEKINRLQVHNDNLESVKAKTHRELFTREGELNRSQARERVAHKEIAELRADLEYEKSQNGKAKLDLEKQALKKACKHHKHKAESFLVQLDESRLDCKRVRSELDAWKERSRRNIDAVEDQAAALHEAQNMQRKSCMLRVARSTRKKLLSRSKRLKLASYVFISPRQSRDSPKQNRPSKAILTMRARMHWLRFRRCVICPRSCRLPIADLTRPSARFASWRRAMQILKFAFTALTRPQTCPSQPRPRSRSTIRS